MEEGGAMNEDRRGAQVRGVRADGGREESHHDDESVSNKTCRRHARLYAIARTISPVLWLSYRRKHQRNIEHNDSVRFQRAL